MEIAVSYLSSFYSKEKTIYLIEKTNADYIHVDLMDGGFVPTKNFSILELDKLLSNHEKPLDIHLMVFDPIIYINDLAKLKPEYITFHLEATKDVVRTISVIKGFNLKVGLSLRPETPLNELFPYLSLIDLVLVMSVEPGKGGQKFKEDMAKRVQELNEFRNLNNLNFKIEVDGGINIDTINMVRTADIVVSGSYICNSKNYQERINNLRNN